MRTNRKLLNAFLAKRARKMALALEALEHLDGVIRVADTGTCRLSPAGADLERRAAKAIADLTGRPCRVRFVSLSRPFPNPGRLTDADYDTELKPLIWTQAAKFTRPKLAEVVSDLNSTSLVKLGSDDWEALWDTMNDAFWFSSWLTIKESIEIGLEASNQLKLHEGLHQAILGYLAAAIVGDADVMRRLSGLILLLPRALPLGEKSNEPGVWLVLAS